ncbi:MAG: hypothetical protein IEMM0008_0349 [bacterium]|nr:MAG: hypothetical protein IEMM0008_0349 [bacterium]
MGFLEFLPREKVKVSEIEEYSHIPYVSEEEEKDIEKTLKNKECHELFNSKR